MRLSRQHWPFRLAQVGLFVSVVILLSAFGCGAGEASDSQPATPAPTFQAARAFQDLVTQCDFGARTPGSAAHDACRAWLIAQFQALSSAVTVQDFGYTAPAGQQFVFTNVAAVFGAPAGRDLSSALLIGAHWDSRPVADRDPDPALRTQPVLGANDGASGIAVLLELGRALQAQPPGRPVILACFDFEDSGNTALTTGQPHSGFSVGARYFANNLGALRPREAIIIDMIGDQHLTLPQEPNSLAAHPDLVRQVWATGQRLGFTAFSDTVGQPITDDHLPFIEVGVPAIDLIDFDYPGPNNHALWHTTHDVPANCSAESLRVVGQTLLQLIYGG